jgi:glycosyltransferase involved in cell wall biosynthesis
MVAGTPVVALRFGSTTELIEHGVTGFLAEDVDGLVAAVERIDEIDRIRCAEVARERFGPHHMAERYLSVYRRGTVELEPLPADGSARDDQLTLPQAVPTR